MELLFVALGGAIAGGLLRYLVPGRAAYGSVLLPAVGLVAASVVWAALTWAGWPFDGGWIWVASLAAAGVAALVTALVLPRRRRRSDASMLTRLARG